MKKIAILMTGLSLFTSVVFASGGYNSAKSCVISYGKFPTTNENLIIACDGQVVLNVKVAAFEPGVENNLFLTFKSMVNSDDAKKCEQFDSSNVWWASCIAN